MRFGRARSRCALLPTLAQLRAFIAGGDATHEGHSYDYIVGLGRWNGHDCRGELLIPRGRRRRRRRRLRARPPRLEARAIVANAFAFYNGVSPCQAHAG
eukprot:2905416-Pyramimonas_sp.AAC.1